METVETKMNEIGAADRLFIYDFDNNRIMKYSKPVLSSNVCSMPEILQEAPIWFSPFFATDIYKAIDTLRQADYEQLCQRSYARYLEVSERQRADLAKLVGLILS